MQCIRKLSDIKSEKRSAVTFGKFDGLHTGHSLLVKKVHELSADEDLTSIVCAFEMSDFLQSIGRESVVLMTSEERAKHLEDQVDYLVNYPFTREFSSMEPEMFIREIICHYMKAKHVVVGADFRFGRKAAGNTETLKLYSDIYGYELHVIDKIQEDQRDISSTYIREILAQGNIPKANKLLGYEYEITGPVVHGKQLGRNLGFPTINIEWPERKIAPPRGVYFVNVLLDGNLYHAIANIGVKPTVSLDNKLAIECFLFQYHGNAYEHEATVKLLEFRRPEMKFDSVQTMKNRVDQDILSAKNYFERN
ncbi:MAG: bifunctional riboflavin kinase/FAD synthetase [Dorea sp.]|nr:bifunctional riboflavin kinase/FAD synthetase [Dorea sp.]